MVSIVIIISSMSITGSSTCDEHLPQALSDGRPREGGEVDAAGRHLQPQTRNKGTPQIQLQQTEDARKAPTAERVRLEGTCREEGTPGRHLHQRGCA